MLKKIKGTGMGVLYEWTTGSNDFWTWAKLEAGDTVRFGGESPSGALSWKGEYKIRIVVEKIINTTAG